MTPDDRNGPGIRPAPERGASDLPPRTRPERALETAGGMVGLAGDVRLAWRQWRRSPSFARQRHASGAAHDRSGHGLLLAAAGVAIGLVGAQLAGGVLETVLFRTATTDAGAMLSAVVVLILSAALACLAPARRAARVAPIEGLKES